MASANKIEYMKEYRKKNPEHWYKSITCPDCGAIYQKSNKTAHEKGIHHKYAVAINKLNTLENALKNVANITNIVIK